MDFALLTRLNVPVAKACVWLAISLWGCLVLMVPLKRRHTQKDDTPIWVVCGRLFACCCFLAGDLGKLGLRKHISGLF